MTNITWLQRRYWDACEFFHSLDWMTTRIDWVSCKFDDISNYFFYKVPIWYILADEDSLATLSPVVRKIIIGGGKAKMLLKYPGLAKTWNEIGVDQSSGLPETVEALEEL